MLSVSEGLRRQGWVAVGMTAHEVEVQCVGYPAQRAGNLSYCTPPFVVGYPVAEIVEAGGISLLAAVAVAEAGQLPAVGFPRVFSLRGAAGQCENGLYKYCAVGLLQPRLQTFDGVAVEGAGHIGGAGEQVCKGVDVVGYIGLRGNNREQIDGIKAVAGGDSVGRSGPGRVAGQTDNKGRE